MTKELKRGKDYEILKPLALGAYGRIFSAYLIESGKPIVVKKSIRKTIDAEYEILKNLVGKANIVQILGYDDTPEGKCILMERALYSLDRLLREVPNLHGIPPNDLIQLCVDLGSALRLLVEEHIVHRDIKPHNILVFGSTNNTPGRSKYTFKLCDFGISREIERQSTAMFSIVGTPLFQHPALIKEYRQHPDRLVMNSPYESKNCDLWSVASTIFMAASGQLPFPPTLSAEETVLMYDGRPEGAIAAEFLGDEKCAYFYEIPNKFYPTWLFSFLNRLIASLMDEPEYYTFFNTMTELSKSQESRLVIIPEYDIRHTCDFTHKNPSLSEILGTPSTPSYFFSALSMVKLEPGKIVNLSESEYVVYGDTIGAAPPRKNYSVRRAYEEEEHMFVLQDASDMQRTIAELLSGWKRMKNILNEQLKLLSLRCTQVLESAKSVQLHHTYTSSLSNLTIESSIMNHGEGYVKIRDSRDTSTVITELGRLQKTIQKCKDAMLRLDEIDERIIPNADDQLKGLSRSHLSDADKKWAQTLAKKVENRKRLIERDLRNKVDARKGLKYVISKLIDCHDKLRWYRMNLQQYITDVQSTIVKSISYESVILRRSTRGNEVDDGFVDTPPRPASHIVQTHTAKEFGPTTSKIPKSETWSRVRSLDTTTAPITTSSTLAPTIRFNWNCILEELEEDHFVEMRDTEARSVLGQASALFTFTEDTTEGTTTIEEGEELLLLGRDDGAGWTRIRSMDGRREGFVPTSYIEARYYPDSYTSTSTASSK